MPIRCSEEMVVKAAIWCAGLAQAGVVVSIFVRIVADQLSR